MKTKLIRKSVPSLTLSEYRQCLKATLGENGEMAGIARRFRHESRRKSRCYIIKDELGHVLAWTLLYLIEEAQDLYDEDVIGWNCQVFILPKVRRLGYGKRMFRAIAKHYDLDDLWAAPWNEASYSFYESVGVYSYKLTMV